MNVFTLAACMSIWPKISHSKLELLANTELKRYASRTILAKEHRNWPDIRRENRHVPNGGFGTLNGFYFMDSGGKTRIENKQRLLIQTSAGI